MFDIIVVGGGPAGATLARLLGKKYKILLLEKRAFEEDKTDHIKSCGGLIAPDAQLMLAKFGLGIPKPVLLSPQLFAVRTIDIDNSLERYYQRHYINVDREKFDRWLAELIPKKVKIINNCIYKSFEERDDKVVVNYSYNGRKKEAKAKILVGADGAFSKVRRQVSNFDPSPQLYIAIQQWFKSDRPLDYYGAIFDSEITSFYSWTIPKEGYLILGSALKPKDRVNQKFNLLKQKMKNHGFKFEKSIKLNGSYLYRPLSNKQISIGYKRVALIGEAAGFISPSSAEGLSYAFKSSLALTKALKNDIADYHAQYTRNLKPLMQNILWKNTKSIAMYNNFLRKIVMKTGLLSIKSERIEY